MKNVLKKPFAVLASIATLGTIMSTVSIPVALANPSPLGTHPSLVPIPTNSQPLTDIPSTTPIKHVIVIYDENVSFDHYFATYPYAKNPTGESPFYAAPGTPTVNGLSEALLTHNPNLANPQRLGPAQAMTADMDHGYTAEQEAFDGGLMDKFVQSTGHGNPEVMDYYDGNTVTAMWNFAQHFALNDNFFGTNDGPSTPGALNLISGQTHGATAYSANITQHGTKLAPGDKGFPSYALDNNGTIYSDVDPYYDSASSGTTIQMTGRNISDLLNAKGLTWGWFQGGYNHPTAQHKNIAGKEVTDYIPHHEPFQYYVQSSNITHTAPSSVAMIGHTDGANHQYGMTDFWQAADAGNMPNFAVLKAPGYEDGHPGYSDPIDEQHWLVQTVNHLESLPEWKDTAIFITYDDSDGWYDHVMPPIINQSDDPNTDALDGKGNSGKPPAGTYLDRAGYGPRLPLIVISPYAKQNAVINSIGDQSSIIRFVEDNWQLGRLGNQSFDALAGSLNDMFDFHKGYVNPPVFLDPNTGEPVATLKPFQQNGQLYMGLNDFAQSMDVRLQQNKNQAWFTYAGHWVEIPFQGNTVTLDMAPLNLGAPILTKNHDIYLPITNLAAALGVKPIRYQPNEILFAPIS